MLKRILAGLIVAVALTAALLTPTFAANNPGASGAAVSTGTCSRLITAADDYTAKCDSQAASVTLADGTVTFVFSVSGTPVGFSGDGRLVTTEESGQARLPVSFVAVGQDAKLGALKAEGLCLFGNPFSGPANIWCVAMTNGGPFLATFKTDGSTPKKE